MNSGLDSALGFYDVAIIGAGVVGCAAARRFALAGARVIVIEKGSDLLSGASKANSAILHTGFDAPQNSLELELVRNGRAEYLAIRQALNLPLLEAGALVCAWSSDEADRLGQLASQARENGIAEVVLLSRAEALGAMPTLSDRLVAAMHVTGEHVIDPWSAPLAYLTQAVALGATFKRGAELEKGQFDGEWHLQTTAGDLCAALVINAAGLFGDVVDERLGFAREFEIRPRKGQFVVLDKAAARLVSHIVLPVPTDVTKGVVVCPTVFGNVLVGPTAEEQVDRVRATVTTAALADLLRRAADIVPALAAIPVTATYAGLRPATEQKSYRVIARPIQRAITLGGIRSTGLSSALGLAQHALTIAEGFGAKWMPPVAAPEPRMPNLAEHCDRDWQQAGHGDIVCHCELVTKREIDAAFASPIPPGDFGGLRRRTRAGMGRCQGFYCHARLAEITTGKFAEPLAVAPEPKV